MPEAPVLSATGLRKRFGAKVAVDGVDLEVARGEIVGFLGPNGAGKTTVMNMIAGLLDPDAGQLSLFGVPGGATKPALRSRIGFLQEKPRVYPDMSGRDYLGLFAALYGVEDRVARVDAAIAAMSLEHAADRKLSTYSRGMQQRVCLARAMLHRPDVLMLDEPTLGLDPAGVSEIRETLIALNRTGVALLFSSHQLAEMERISDRVILMDQGRVVAAGTRADLARETFGSLVVEVELAAVTPAIERALGGLPFVTGGRRRGERVVALDVDSPEADLLGVRVAISGAATAAGGAVLSVSARSATLEEVFLQMTHASRH